MKCLYGKVFTQHFVIFGKCEGFSEAMAPKESETSSAIFSYLSQQNRPYSANDLHLNLHKEHGKAAIQKVVDAMVEGGKLKVKVNGKQTCYFVNQVRDQLDLQN